MDNKWLNIVVFNPPRLSSSWHFKTICLILAIPGLTPQKINHSKDSASQQLDWDCPTKDEWPYLNSTSQQVKKEGKKKIKNQRWLFGGISRTPFITQYPPENGRGERPFAFVGFPLFSRDNLWPVLEVRKALSSLFTGGDTGTVVIGRIPEMGGKDAKGWGAVC